MRRRGQGQSCYLEEDIPAITEPKIEVINMASENDKGGNLKWYIKRMIQMYVGGDCLLALARLGVY